MHIALVGPELEENLSLRYLRGALEAEGHVVTQVDFEAPRNVERCARRLVDSGAAIAGFSMVFTRRAEEFAALITRCRALGFRGMTLAGGHFAAFHPEQLLRDVPALDVIAIGEGEWILCELARDPSRVPDIRGLVYRDGNTVKRNPPAAPEQDLDKIPWPTHRRPFDKYHGLPIVNMLSSRGCTHACGFCSIAAWHKLCGGARYRVRSPGNIAGEMACLYREGVRLFNFHDDNFLGRDRDENIARAEALREALRAQGVGKMGSRSRRGRTLWTPSCSRGCGPWGCFGCSSASRRAPKSRCGAWGAGRRSRTTSAPSRPSTTWIFTWRSISWCSTRSPPSRTSPGTSPFCAPTPTTR